MLFSLDFALLVAELTHSAATHVAPIRVSYTLATAPQAQAARENKLGDPRFFGAKFGFPARVESQKVHQNGPPTFYEHAVEILVEQTLQKMCHFRVRYSKC